MTNLFITNSTVDLAVVAFNVNLNEKSEEMPFLNLQNISMVVITGHFLI